MSLEQVFDNTPGGHFDAFDITYKLIYICKFVCLF